MHIIGTGLFGFVGSRIAELLPNHKFHDISLESGIDILNVYQLDDFFKKNSEADSVIHFAAFTDTTAAWVQKGDKNGSCWRVNVEGTRNILDLCKKYSKYLILISTDYVFDGTKSTPYKEADKPQPLDWYGETKYEAEQMVLNSNHNAAVVRIAYPYRTHFDLKIDLVRKIVGKLQNGQVVNLFDDQITTPTFVDDVAYGLEKLVEKKAKGIFHLVASSHQSVYQMGLDIAKVFELDSNLVKPASLHEYLKTPGIRPYAVNGALSNEYTQKVLGIEMKKLTESLIEMKKQAKTNSFSCGYSTLPKEPV